MTSNNPTKSSLVVLNLSFFKAIQSQNFLKLSNRQTFLGIILLLHWNLLSYWNQKLSYSNRGHKKLVIIDLYRSSLPVTVSPASYRKKYGSMIPLDQKPQQTLKLGKCNSCSFIIYGCSSHQNRQLCLFTAQLR